MASIDITRSTMTVRLTRFEKIFGLLRDQVVPREAVTDAEAVPNGLSAAHGMRAPGLALPGHRKIGTWRGRGIKRLVCVRRGEPALLVRLTGFSYDELVISSPDAESLAAQLRAAR